MVPDMRLSSQTHTCRDCLLQHFAVAFTCPVCATSKYDPNLNPLTWSPPPPPQPAIEPAPLEAGEEVLQGELGILLGGIDLATTEEDESEDEA